MRELSRESRALLDAAQGGDDPSAMDRKRVRRALARKIAVAGAVATAAGTASHAAAGGVASSGAAVSTVGAGVGAGVAAGTTAAGASSVTAGAVATGFGVKLLASVAVVGAMSAGTIGYVAYRQPAKQAPIAVATAPADAVRASAPSTPPARTRAATAATPSPVEATAPLAVAASPAVAPVVPAEKPSAPAKPNPPPSPAVASSSEPDLNAELLLLRDAQQALQSNDGARALSLLDDHERRFPSGALSEEAEAARVFALRQVGRSSEARDLASRFLREHPRSPLSPRVARAFDGDAPTF